MIDTWGGKWKGSGKDESIRKTVNDWNRRVRVENHWLDEEKLVPKMAT
jgi:hypothetical protein